MTLLFAVAAGSHEAISEARAISAGATLDTCPIEVESDGRQPCFGDCSGDGVVTVDEIVRAVGLVLGDLDYAACPVADSSRDAQVTVDELIGSVNRSLEGCPAVPVVPAEVGCADDERFCNQAMTVGLDIPSYGKGASMVDVDGDGFDDIWAADSDMRVSQPYGTSKLYHNRGDGTFERMDLGIDPDHLRFNWTASFADADNDGDQDVLLVNGGFSGKERLRFYRNDWSTQQRFVDVTEASGISTDLAQWWSATWADYDGDGLLDVFVNPWEGRPRLYRNLGSLRFADVTAEAGLGNDTEATAQHNAVWIDIDADGDPDLYRAGTIRDWLHRNDGPAGFTDISENISIAEEGLAIVFAAAAADFNHDGFDDLYLGRWSLQDYVLLNRGDGTFAAHGRDIGLDMVLGNPLKEGTDDPNGYENTMGLAIYDFDDDGDHDVFIGTGNPSFKFVDVAFCNTWSATGALQFQRCSDFLVRGHGQSQTHGIVFGDVDHDGDSDSYFSIGGMAMSDDLPPAEGALSLDAFYRQDAPQSRTAVVQLTGSRSNRDAIGAKIRVDGPRPKYRTIRSQQGFPSQNSKAQVITVGADGAAHLTLQWPAGGQCGVTVFAGERLRILEP